MKFLKLILIFLTFFGTISGTDYPRRIISLAPAITRNLYLLGAGERIVGVTIFCRKYAQKKEIVGTLLELNSEKIVSLRPDLVIASKDDNNRESVNKLASLGLKIHVLGESNSFTDICSGFLELGRIIGNGRQAAAIIKIANQKIDVVKNRVLHLVKPSVFWELGTKPVFTACRKSFINDFMEIAGGRNIFLDLDKRYSQVSREEVMGRNGTRVVSPVPAHILRPRSGAGAEWPRIDPPGGQERRRLRYRARVYVYRRVSAAVNEKPPGVVTPRREDMTSIALRTQLGGKRDAPTGARGRLTRQGNRPRSSSAWRGCASAWRFRLGRL